MKNSRNFHETEERGIQLDLEDAGTVEAALYHFDGPFTIGSLPEVAIRPDEEPEPDGGRARVVQVLLQERILSLIKY